MEERRGPQPQLLKAKRHGWENRLCWDPRLRDPSGFPAPGNSLCLKEDQQRLTKLELAGRYEPWAKYPGCDIFTGLIPQVPWFSVKGAEFVPGSISILITELFVCAQRLGDGRDTGGHLIEGT